MTEQNDNMRVWHHADETDPSATKTAKIDGNIQTAISAYWMFKKATELFGPVGKGWGFDIVEERTDGGHDQIDSEGNVIGQARTHTVQIKLWYEKRDQYVIAFGHTPYVQFVRSGNYWRTDGEAPKKSLTDALKKALSMLGFAADVFLGQFDDPNYVEAQVSRETIDKATDKAKAAKIEADKYAEKLAANIETMKGALSLHEFESIYKALIREAHARDSKTAQRQIAVAYEQKKLEFKNVAKSD